MKNNTLDILCQAYARRIGNEIGWLTEIIKNGNSALICLANPKFKNSMFELNDQVVFASQKMQIVYLVNLFESFMQDYITLKDGLTELEINKNDFWSKYLASEKSEWNINYNEKGETYNNSTSFMNVRFSLYVLNQKYGLTYPSYLTSTIPELGSLRNCLVHYDGDLSRMDKGGHPFKKTLLETLKFLNIGGNEIKLTKLDTNDFLNKVIFDFQTFIELIGGRINRPKDHEKEKNASC